MNPNYRKVLPFLEGEGKHFALAVIATTLSSIVTLGAPFLFGYAVDHYISVGDYAGVLMSVGILFVGFAVALVTSYWQMQLMGRMGQRVLFRLRSVIFSKLQELPIAFFNRQKTGDLISRINNDTDKLNQFLSETLVRFVGSMVIILGAAIFLLSLNWELGLAALVPAIVLIVLTRLVSGWVKARTTASLKAMGGLSAEVSESLDHFKVIVAFDRRDYFRTRFQEANTTNYKAAVSAGLANGMYGPMYDLASNIAQLIVLVFGISLITKGFLSVGMLLTFLIFVERCYGPLRQIAMLWQSLQLAIAGWDRVSEILDEKSNIVMVDHIGATLASPILMEFRDVSFAYGETKVINTFNFELEKGKTYALVGPTGGGKTTTASLMARLYDPTEGLILLDGRDLRSYSDEERTKKIGFILQEAFLFSGTVLENVFYGNSEFLNSSKDERVKAISDMGLDGLLVRFPQGVDTEVTVGSETISLGQRQLIAFMRAVLRKPELLILDEATANIDTVTEQLLEETLQKLPRTTTRVIIAHRLNTIENADSIFFVNGGKIQNAGSLEHAMEMLMHGKRNS
ncbi:MAG: ABC transporter ATP-binding protein [Candidatus Uhrbacteria bacterium]